MKANWTLYDPAEVPFEKNKNNLCAYNGCHNELSEVARRSWMGYKICNTCPVKPSQEELGGINESNDQRSME